MADQEDITGQKELLATHRRTLAHLLKRAALVGGETFLPPEVSSSIQDARSNIQRIKNVLQDWGVIVESHPNDEPHNQQENITPNTARQKLKKSPRRSVNSRELMAAPAIDEIPSVQEVEEYKRNIKRKSLKSHREFIPKIGLYFLTTSSDINNDYILAVEALLNQLYLKSFLEKWPAERKEALLEALSTASELSDTIRKLSGEPRQKRFFRASKELGEVLQKMEI